MAETTTNTGTILVGITLGGDDSLINAATGVVTGPGSAVVGLGGTTAATVDNAGIILGDNQPGVELLSGGIVTNRSAATISAAGAVGVTISGGAGTVRNSGTVRGTAASVLLTAGYTNRVIFSPGAVFNGTVSGGNTIGATAVSTLELASGASVGTLSGLGTQFVNFAAVTVDAGAAWVLASGNSLVPNQTLLVDGTLTNQASLSQSITLGQNGLLTNSATGTLVTAVGYHGSGATHQTVVNAGRLGNTNVRGVHLDSSGTLTNLSSGTIVGRVGGGLEVRDARYAVVMESDGVVVNAGRIIGGSRVFGVGVVLDGGGTLTNQSSGSISGHDGIMARVGAATVVNAGTVNGQQAAIDMYAGGLVTNQTGGVVLGNNSILFRTIAGTIINDGLISAPHFGVELRAGGSITNQASGTIVSTGVGYYGSDGIAIRTRGLSTLVNSGSIGGNTTSGTGIDLDTGLLTNQASATVAGYIGVKLGAATLVNAGLILGDAAYGRAVSFNDTTSVTKGTVTVTNQATGTLQAATGFYVFGGNATLANAGLIVGSTGTAAQFAAGYTNRLILTNGAVFTGLVDGGNTIGATAVSTLELGFGATEGTLSSLGTQFVNFAAITVAVGGIWSIDPASPVAANQSLLVGGTLVNRDTLTHAVTFSSGGVVSNAATGTISTDTISVFGATVGGDGTVLNDGVILGTAAAVGLLSGGGVSNASTGRIAGTSVGVYLTTSSTVANSGSVFNAGTIIGTTAQGIEIAAGGTVSNAGTGLISGGYRGLSIGVPNTAQSALVFNGGSIVGGTGAGVSVGAGTITNVAGGTISGVTRGIDATGRLTLVDGGVIVATGGSSRAVYLHAGGVVSVQSAGRVTGGASGIDIVGADGTITNAGSIVGSSAGASGIRLQAGGSISNAASGDIIAAFGVYISNVAATVSNSGTLRGTVNNGVALSVGGSVTNAASGTIVGHYSAVNFHTAAASVSNAGTLTSTDASGVNGNVGGMITNLSGGTIQGRDYGVVLSGAAGTVSNAGIVIGTNNRGVYLSAGGVVTNASAGTIFGYGGVAIDGAAGTVVNLGSIGASGANAVRLAANFTNRLVVSAGAAFTGKVDGGNTIGATAASTLELASSASAGTITGFGGQFVNFANTTIDAGASWTLTGTNTLALGATLTNAGTLTLLNASLNDAGVLVNNGGIILDPSTLVVGDLTGNGSVTIAAGSTLEVTGTVSIGETIVFGGADAFLKIDSPAAFAGRILNFGAGQTIDLVGIAPATVGYTSGSGVLNFGTSGGTIALSSVSPAPLNAIASDDGVGLTSTLCFRANTMILTPSGERSVRDLRVGDAVTVWGGGTRPIMWIGEGRVLATRGRRGPATPAIVRKGALGDNVPARDLHVTKGHALYVDDVLIPVEFLVNHRSIVWDDHAQEVELYHIELDRHDVLIANGAPAESYRDDGNRWLFQNANNGWDLPALEPFAPVLTGGPIVDAAWRRILDRAGPRDNLTLTDDPDLHLRVDGKRINPLFGDGDRFMFRLRADADEIRLMSRTGVPSELGVARDARALGVAVRAIRLRTDTWIWTIGAADERLTDGFHAFEADNDIRWTNGDASLPIDRLGTARGTLLLEVVLGGRTRYLDTGYGSVAGSVAGRAAA